MRRPPSSALILVGVLTLVGCAPAAPAETSAASAEGDGHGAIAGAQELAEAPLALLTIDAAGATGITDLVSGDVETVGETGAPLAVQSDGRYAFVTTADGLEVVDSGRWSWDHVDHFHFYRAEARTVGLVPGAGDAVVTTGMLSTTGSTGVFFADSGEAVLLDNEALADGEIVESFRIDTDQTTGIVAPVGDGAVVALGDELVFHEADGTPTDSAIACAEPSGAITTRVGVVIGCADEAILTTWSGGAPTYESIPYPADTADRAEAFAGRKGRPTVAGLVGGAGFWMLDTRERSWSLVPTTGPLARVAAVDDAEGHVVGLDEEGRIHVFAEGAESVVTASVTAMGPAVSLVVDENRAYVNDPAAGVVLEIDYADGGRIARTIETSTPAVHFTEVGR